MTIERMNRLSKYVRDVAVAALGPEISVMGGISAQQPNVVVVWLARWDNPEIECSAGILLQELTRRRGRRKLIRQRCGSAIMCMNQLHKELSEKRHG